MFWDFGSLLSRKICAAMFHHKAAVGVYFATDWVRSELRNVGY